MQLYGIKIRDKEIMLFYLRAKNIDFWKRNQWVGSKKQHVKPDGIIKCKSFYIIIECDENFHSSGYSTELGRMMFIREQYNKEVVFLWVGTKNGSIVDKEQLKTVLHQVEKYSKMNKIESKVVKVAHSKTRSH